MESLPAKICTQCGEVKPMVEFSKKSAAPDGYQSSCKICKSAAHSKYRAENREALLAQKRKHYQDNREREILRSQNYAADHKEDVLLYRKEYYEKNREASLAYGKEYYEENKEARALYSKEYREKNKEAVAASKREYGEANKESINAYGREYAKNNPHIYSEAKRRRRARKLNNGVEKYTELQVLALYGTDCHICKRPVDMSAPRAVGRPGWETGLHIEHVVAIANGGPDTLENVRPSHGQCNLKKNARLI
jgi:5-methylcytosine-specific restriction endonuclease McrA